MVTIYLAGDSTVSNYEKNRAPRAGWGQTLQNFMKDEIIVQNEAASGRSSKSFIDEGRLDLIERTITEGDYLFIQFGHNDSKVDKERYTEPYTSFKSYLSLYIDVARNNHAYPLLVTPVQRRSFNEFGELQETHGRYPEAIRELATTLAVPMIDLTKKSKELFDDLGPERTKELFLWLQPAEHPHYLEGIQDDTHFSETGARTIAKLVVEGIIELDLPLANYINIRGGA
ncbi:rhamnogalacturonan acetylesterase [Halalkalibacter okhensis]|uniref:Rhamnogalacturonan acetylesterase n=1 Tax=Halalkalibacter okhensis TaxID=333138 RepID=A0A0B0ICD8_9BACI|nr:rhamnogalacturonan acetylesterase [Halalkalibacter okhensis]KHF40238.1 rhamnogalacturonan acetylesterase [Halalkalibacter okhensis]